MNRGAAADPDWRDAVLADAVPLPGSETIGCAVARFGEQPAVVATWHFTSHGGSFGAADADALIAAVDVAIERRLPLVTLIRSGGTRLPEGMRALVGIPRTTLALQRLRAAGLPHLSVADHPTMGGVWVSVGSRADVRIAIKGALIGFSGPRAVAAMTGRDLSQGAGTAEAAYDAGLVDTVIEPADAAVTVQRALATLRPDDPRPVSAIPSATPPVRDGWEQVVASRTERRPTGSELLDMLLTEVVELRGADTTVRAALGRLAGRRVLAVALAADRAAMPTRAGFDLLTRAAATADALDLGLLCLVDTPGADPHDEVHGLSPAIGEAMAAVLACRAPTVCLVHGEGGSGGALAGAVTDLVGVGDYGWFAALGPEGAAATLRTEPREATRLMRVRPVDLVTDGVADEVVATGAEISWTAAALDRLRTESSDHRLRRRRRRWSSPLPPALPSET